MRLLATTLLLMPLLYLGGCAAPQQVAEGPAQINYWEQRKGDCEQVLMAPQHYEIEQLTRCTKLWESYREVDDLSLSSRSLYALAFSRVWYESTANGYDQQIAEAALQRICIPRHPQVNGVVQEEPPSQLHCSPSSENSKVAQTPLQESDWSREIHRLRTIRASVAIAEASKKDLQRAKAYNKKGLQRHNKAQYFEAIDHFERALGLAPFHLQAQYNLVCALARLGDHTAALDALEELYSWDDSRVDALLIKARSDKDLIKLHDEVRFKALTGYFHLKLANDPSADNLNKLSRLKEELALRDYLVEDVVSTTDPISHNQIWYKAELEGELEAIKLILGEKARTYLITEPSLEDMVIYLSGPLEKPAAPIVQGVGERHGENGLNEFTEGVNKTQKEIEGTINAGEGAIKAVPR